MGLHTPATVAIRSAIRRHLELIPVGQVVLIGCSGGADSMALTVGTKLESAEHRIIPVVVDHGLQEDSAKVAEATCTNLRSHGFAEIFQARASITVTDGLEASARRARYQIFHQALDTYGAEHFLLAHTLNDQAETVLLGLARGSGTRSLSAMAERNPPFIRPLLGITRDITENFCDEQSIDYWHDPHNDDPTFTRVRIRKKVLPVMEREMGPGITSALARSARIFREDADALDLWADEVFSQTSDPHVLEIATLEKLPIAVRSRVLRLAIYAVGAPSGSINADHLLPIEALVTEWNGQGEVSLPGGVKVSRISGRLSLSRHGAP
jgi:tRNA(Ile)-lysidine synthase